MAPRVEDLDLKSISVNPEFEVVCPKWISRKYDKRPDPYVPSPLDLPERLDQCCHVEMVEYLQKYERCSNKTHEVDGRHGWLCKKHLADQQTQTELQAVEQLKRAGVDRNSDWDVEPLQARMQPEVLDATVHSKAIIDYKDYVRWGWSFNSNPFEMDPDYEMVPED